MKSYLKKSILGTAQLGIEYGISNNDKSIDASKANKILLRAVELGIDTYDTAYSYGKSEEFIGKFIYQNSQHANKMKIISKMPHLTNNDVDRLDEYFKISLDRLNQESIYCYMVHNAVDIINDNNRKIIQFIEKLKSEKKISKFGVSVYNSSEIEYLIKNIPVDIIQIPFNLFDQRLIFDGTLALIKQNNIEIHARSIFLQGLVFLNKDNIPDNLKEVIPVLESIGQTVKQNNITKLELCYGFICFNDMIDKFLFGVDNLKQLNENIDLLNNIHNLKEKFDNIDFSQFIIDNENILNPAKW